MMQRVVVAMSGGVDSSVAAALLVEQGYDVVGMMLRLWVDEHCGMGNHNRCCTPDQMEDARKVAAQLGIPFYVIDAKDIFRKAVVDYFIAQHRLALTPNPCLECNRHIRFSFLLRHAMALDAAYLATGHYAIIEQDDAHGEFVLKRAVDHAKDQSYVLSVLGQDQLRHVLFPNGRLTKPEVRELAARFQLSVADKADSQDLCFVEAGDYRHFLSIYAPEVMSPGAIITQDGEVVGQHKGLANYTVGQRRGLDIGSSETFYVIRMDPSRNTLIVGRYEDLHQAQFTVCRMNWISDHVPERDFAAGVKVRYKSKILKAIVTPLSTESVMITLEHPQPGIAPGQGAVLYTGDVCLGGGIIERMPVI